MVSVIGKLKNAFNVFFSSPEETVYRSGESSYGSEVSSYEVTTYRGGTYSPYTPSIAMIVKNRLALDIARIPIRHVKVNDRGAFVEVVPSGLNSCLTIRPNIDQSPIEFYLDLVMTMFDHGCAAVVAVETDSDTLETDGFDVRQLRVGRVARWYPRHVVVDLYNDVTGNREKVSLPKENVAIIANPLSDLMSSGNSAMSQLASKQRLLDAVDRRSASGKLDLIIQLPYEVRSDIKRTRSEERRKDIEKQLQENQLGIAYIGANEKITQLNRPVTNNLLEQVEALENKVLASLGLTSEIMNGTATSQTMTNYYARVINPILELITSNMSSAFLSRNKITRNHRIMWFRSPFELIPMDQLPEIAISMTSGEIVSKNEVRPYFGFSPSSDSTADQLRNPNVNPLSPEEVASNEEYAPTEKTGGEVTINELMDRL